MSVVPAATAFWFSAFRPPAAPMNASRRSLTFLPSVLRNLSLIQPSAGPSSAPMPGRIAPIALPSVPLNSLDAADPSVLPIFDPMACTAPVRPPPPVMACTISVGKSASEERNPVFHDVPAAAPTFDPVRLPGPAVGSAPIPPIAVEASGSCAQPRNGSAFCMCWPSATSCPFISDNDGTDAAAPTATEDNAVEKTLVSAAAASSRPPPP